MLRECARISPKGERWRGEGAPPQVARLQGEARRMGRPPGPFALARERTATGPLPPRRTPATCRQAVTAVTLPWGDHA